MATSEAYYRNAIDLNRYSNSVTKKLITAYNEIILDVTAQLAAIDDITAPDTATRLRTILAQAKENLERWAVTSTNATAEELQGLAELQTEFAQEQLRQLLPNPQRSMVRTVEVSPAFARSVVTTDPTKLNLLTLPEQFADVIKPTFSLTARQGSMITLPNGQTIEKTFRGLASSQADLFSKTVRNGLLTGETTQQMARRLKGRLQFGQEATTARQIALARGSVREIIQKGGELTRMANHQVNTVVRTSINQVANVASDTVYRANDDITEEYEYVATLDSRTSAICARLDGQKFPYGKGPKPPQHFNCRSTTIPVLKDEFYEKFGLEKEDLEPTKRPAKFGKDQKARQVPAGMTYGEWLSKQPKGVQEEVLGKTKAKYFRRLAKTEKKGPQGALRSIVQKDGSELTLKQLRTRYGPPEAIKAVKKVTPKPVSVKKTVKKTTPKPVTIKKVVPKPVLENKYAKRFGKLSNRSFEEDYDFNKSDLSLKKRQAEGILRRGRSGSKAIEKAKQTIKEVDEGLNFLEKRHKEIVAQWRAENLPQVSGVPVAIGRLNDKDMLKSLKRYEKELNLREKGLNPQDPFLEDKLDSIRGQQLKIEKAIELQRKGTPVSEWDDYTEMPMGYLYDRQGFNARPTRVKTVSELKKSKDLLKGADGENLILYRGVKSKGYSDQFKGIGPDGGQHYPGHGIFGNGTYAASRNFYSTGAGAVKGSKDAFTTAQSYATAFDFSLKDIKKGRIPEKIKKERITAMAFKKDAKVLKWKKGKEIVEGADAEWMEWETAIREEAQEKTGLPINSTGEAAAALGYDAYQVPAAGVGTDEDFWVIFNRGALVVSDNPL